MRKQYICPSAMTVVVSLRMMMAQSGFGINTEKEVGYDDVLAKEYDGGGNASAGSIWDNEW